MIERLKELDAGATPRPWKAVTYGVHTERKAIAGKGFIDICDGVYCDQPDADLIAEMRNALPNLLAAAEALEMLTHRVEQHMGGQGSDNLLYSYLPFCQQALSALDENSAQE